MIGLSLVICKLDPAMFFLLKEGVLCGIICIHVNDSIWAGTGVFKRVVLKGLEQFYKIGNVESRKFQYLGIYIHQKEGVIVVDQNRYLEELREIELEKGRNNHRQDFLKLPEKKHLQELIGQLNWLSTQTRQDISFDVCDLSSRINIAVVDDVIYINKFIRKLKLQSVSLVFSNLMILDPYQLIAIVMPHLVI